MSRTPRRASDPRKRRLLLGAGSACVMLAVVIAVGVLYARPLLAGPALTQLVITGNLQHVSPQAVRAVVRAQVGSGFFTTNVDAVRAAVAALPWIEAVSVRRGWPHTLYIGIDEETPAARWNGGGLMDAQGRVFATRGGQEWPKLPQLSGPDGSAAAVLNEYYTFGELLTGKGLAIRQMDMDARGSVTLALSDGISVRLGRQQAEVRLERFASVALPVLTTQLPQVAYVDMRYTNGFAVGYCGSAGGTPATANARQASRVGNAAMDGSENCAPVCGTAGQPTTDGPRNCGAPCLPAAARAAQPTTSASQLQCATVSEAQPNG